MIRQPALGTLTRGYGILVRAGVAPISRYLFLHRTFQEYLLAWSLGRRDEEECRSLLEQYLYDPAWLEPLSLLGSVWGRLDREEPRSGYGVRIRACVTWLLRETPGISSVAPSCWPAAWQQRGRRHLPDRLFQGMVDLLIDCMLENWVIFGKSLSTKHWEQCTKPAWRWLRL